MSIQVLCYNGSSGPECDITARSMATIVGSLVEQNHEAAVVVSGSDAILDSTVVRRTLPRAADQGGGRGLHFQVPCIGSVDDATCDAAAVTTGTVTRSLVEDNHETGVFVAGGQVTIEAA